MFVVEQPYEKWSSISEKDTRKVVICSRIGARSANLLHRHASRVPLSRASSELKAGRAQSVCLSTDSYNQYAKEFATGAALRGVVTLRVASALLPRGLQPARDTITGTEKKDRDKIRT